MPDLSLLDINITSNATILDKYPAVICISIRFSSPVMIFLSRDTRCSITIIGHWNAQTEHHIQKEIGRKKIIDGLFMGAIYWSRRPRSISASNVALLWIMRNLFSASYSNIVFAYNRCYSLLSISLMPASSLTSLVPGIPKFNKTIGISILLLCELQNYIYWCRYRTQINKPVY